MRKKLILCGMAVLSLAHSAIAQDRLMREGHHDRSENVFKRAYFGMGLGMDYGGIGVKAEFLPIKYVGIFAGAGYNIVGLGFNAGVSVKALPDAKITPTLIGMYGYNSVIAVQNAPDYNKTYYGPTAGIGGELKVGRRDNKLYAALLYPFRNKAFDDDYEKLKADPAISVQQDKLPLTFSIGFNFAL